MPRKKGTTRRRKRSANLATTEKKVESEMSNVGLNYHKLGGLIIGIIGAILVVWNLEGVLLAFIGLVLIYFGLRLWGFKLKF